jgi:antirestriction protein
MNDDLKNKLIDALILNDNYLTRDQAEKIVDDNYQGEFESTLDFAADLFNEFYSDEASEKVLHYTDYDRFERDIFITDYFYILLEYQLHIFSNY